MPAAALPLTEAAQRLRRRPGRPRLTEAEKRRRDEERAQLSDEERAAQTAQRRRRRDIALAAVRPRVLDLEGASRYLSVSVGVVRSLVASGKVPRVVLAGADGHDIRRTLIDVEDLDALVVSSKEALA